MALPSTVEEALPYRTRVFLNAIAKAGEEATIDIASCPNCGASVGEYCRGRTGRLFTSGMHVGRRVIARRWKKDNRAEWIKLKDHTFARILRLQKIR